MKKILLVEDDQSISLAIGMSLKAMGYELFTAADAATAVAQARKANPDVAILDINLPGGDGFVVAERLQQLVQTSSVPIIFITASKQEGLRERAKQLGAVHFIEKPFGVTQLADAIETAFAAPAELVGDVQIG